MNRIPKLLKMEKHYAGIINYADDLLTSGRYSYRQIAQKLREKFSCNLSYESVRQYDIFRNHGCSIEDCTPIFYYSILKIRRKNL